MSVSILLRNRAAGMAVAAAFLIAVAMADYWWGPDITFSLFYILIVAYVGWITQHLRLALAGAFVAAVTWLVADWFTFGASRPGVLIWNAASRLAILVTIGILISRLKRALDAEKGLARTDYLTGVLNARAFAELAAAELMRARRFNHPLAVVYIDVDNFKGINDTLGHAYGDRVLRDVASTLRLSTRVTDTVARVGGDEFVLLLPETGRNDAEQVLEKITAALTRAMARSERAVTFSIGVAAYETPPSDVKKIIEAADAMMYRAKAGGKDRVQFDNTAA